ncbi:MAG TPA: hypothetical protein VJQ82_19085 [Terriglobales bacterium]|nr:hypothetical protein [Terriglobales bacterium]
MSATVATRAGYLVTAVLVCSFASGQTSVRNVPPALDVIIGHMRQVAVASQPQPLSVVREYRFTKGTSGEVTSKVLARLDYDSDGLERYSIQQTIGSSRGEDIVKRILEHEVITSPESRKLAVNSENYDFMFAGMSVFDGQQCYLLRLLPKRQDPGLIAGQAWVDQRSFRLLHIEGNMVRTPSWWLKTVSVEITFSNVGGRWVQTTTRADADVRMIGARSLHSQVVSSEAGQGVTAGMRGNSGRSLTTPVIPAEILLRPLRHE